MLMKRDLKNTSTIYMYMCIVANVYLYTVLKKINEISFIFHDFNFHGMNINFLFSVGSGTRFA